MALVLAITMFVVGIIMAIFGIPFYSMMPFFNYMPMMAYIVNSGIVAILFVVIMPIMMFLVGLIVSAFAVFIYNLLASKIGGIKLNLE